MDKKLKIALIGCGNFMYDFFYDCTKKLPIELVAICDINEERLDRFSRRYSVSKTYTDYMKLIKEETLDAVICIADAQLHYEVAKNCMLAGLNVFIEKTPCMNVEQATELLTIQKTTGKYTMVGFNRRFTTSYAMAKDLINKEEFGHINMYMAKYMSSNYKSEEYFIFNHIVHHLDLARFLLGEIKSIHTDVIRRSDTRVGFNISFVCESGAIGTLQSGSLLDESYPMERVDIMGDRRNIFIDGIKRLEYNRPGTAKDITQDPTLEDGMDTLVWNINYGNVTNYSFYGFEKELYHFTDSILKGKAPEPNMEDSIHTMELLEMFKLSL